MKEAIVILTLMGCDHGENNCDYIETASQTYSTELACLHASEDQILGVSDADYPVIMANCEVQSLEVAGSEVEPLLDNELHEPDLAQVPIIEDEATSGPIAGSFGAIKALGSSALGSVWQVAAKTSSVINPF